MAAAADAGIDINGARVAIQGFGNVGSFTARFLHEKGAKIVAVSDVGGGLHDPSGLDVDDLLRLQAAEGGIQGAAADKITNEELLELECDILIPAALGGVISQANAARVSAKMVVEAANSPITTIGDCILGERDILIVPDILANAGGVTVSYFEWVQNIQVFAWDEDRVNENLTRIMMRTYKEVRDVMDQRGLDMRSAAFSIAIQRVAEAERLRGG